MEMNNADDIAWLLSDNIKDPFLESYEPTATFKPPSFSVFVQFVPFSFTPSTDADLREIEEVNSMPRDSIIRAKWVKPPLRRAKSQSCGHLILVLSSPQSANKILTDGLRVAHKLVFATKCKREPIRCLKCHGWNHIANECTVPQDICGTCGGLHRTANCDNPTVRYCTPCGDKGHSTWDRNCPTFQRKCQDQDTRSPENNMPYFPTDEDWTQVTEPTNPPRPQQLPHLPRDTQQQTPRQSTLAFTPAHRNDWHHNPTRGPSNQYNDQRNWNHHNGPMDNGYPPLAQHTQHPPPLAGHHNGLTHENRRPYV
jgi:hypothetical protein